MAREHIDAKDFFEPAGVGIFIGIIISLIIFVAFLIASDDHRIEFNYKEALFLSVAGKAGDINYGNEETEEAVKIGEYLRREHEKGITLNNIIEKEKELYPVFEELMDKNTRRLKVYLMKNVGLSEEFLLMVGSSNWKAIINTKDSLQALRLLLSGKEVSEINYDSNIMKWFLITALLIIQFSVLIAYLIDRQGYHIKWHQVPWGKVGTYLTICALLPGALPLMVIAGFISLGSFDFKEKFQSRRENRSQGSFSAGITNPNTSPEESQKLIEKLRKRLD